jgi:hypothetical protein
MVILYSTPESAASGKISVLAIIETICATTLYFGIAYFFDYWNHIIISSILSPLMLLSSKQSTIVSISCLRKLKLDKFEKEIPKNRTLFSLFFMVFLSLYIIFSKITSIVYTIWLYKFRIIENIPANWRKFALSIDLVHPPEIFAGMENYLRGQDVEFPISQFTISRMSRRWKLKSEQLSLSRKILRSISYIWAFFLIFTPSLILRWSVKGTSIFYLPLIYFSNDLSMRRDSPGARAARIIGNKSGVLWATIGVCGILTIAPLLFSATLSGLRTEFINSEKALYIIDYLSFYPHIEKWNISRLICAIITIFLYIMSIIQIKFPTINGQLFIIDGVIRIFNIIRAILSTYIIFCAIILVVEFDLLWVWVRLLDFSIPTIGERWFPLVQN